MKVVGMWNYQILLSASRKMKTKRRGEKRTDIYSSQLFLREITNLPPVVNKSIPVQGIHTNSVQDYGSFKESHLQFRSGNRAHPIGYC